MHKNIAMKNSEGKYRKLVENIRVMVYQFDPKTYKATYVNSAVKKIFGYTSEEWLSVPGLWGKTVHPDDKERTLAEFTESLKKSENTVMYYRIIRKDGVIRWLEDHTSFGKDQQGNVISADGVIYDITERKRAEKALRESEEKYRMLYELTPVMMHSIDRNGKLVSVSNYWLEFLGYERGEVIGRRSTDFLTASSSRYAQEEVLPMFMQTGVCKDIEYQFVKKNGEVLDTLLSAIAERDPSGQIVRSLAVIIDISKSKRAEEAVQESEKRFRLLSEVSFDGIAVTENGVFLEVNKEFACIFGYEPSEIIGKHLSKLVAPEHFDDVLQKIYSGYDKVYETVVIRKDGTRFPVEVSGRTFPYKNRILRISAVRDITERKELEKSLIDIEERERQRIGHDLHDSLGQLLTGIAFKIQTIESRLEELSLDEAKDAARISSLVEQAKEQVSRLARGLSPVEIDSEGLTAALERLASYTEKMFGIPCVFMCDNLISVHDKTAVAQLFRIAQEAVTNSVKHGKPGRIDISLANENGKIIMSIKDDGTGIPEKPELTNGMGLKIMHYRASVINASLDIRRGNDGGTVVTCAISVS